MFDPDLLSNHKSQWIPKPFFWLATTIWTNQMGQGVPEAVFHAGHARERVQPTGTLSGVVFSCDP